MLNMADSSVLKIICLMSKKTFEVYCLQICGKAYRVKLGHLDEFIALHRQELEVDELTIYGLAWDSSSFYSHPYEWYRIV
jgi:hypothetical protein